MNLKKAGKEVSLYPQFKLRGRSTPASSPTPISPLAVFTKSPGTMLHQHLPLRVDTGLDEQHKVSFPKKLENFPFQPVISKAVEDIGKTFCLLFDTSGAGRSSL